MIAFYTKTDKEVVQNPEVLSGVTNITILAFYKARQLYIPNYEITKPAHKKPDYPRTSNWEPDIKIGTNSALKLKFYTGDYIIRTQGTTNGSRPVSQLHNFKVLD